MRDGSPSRTSATSIVPSGVKSRPTTRSTTWWSSLSAPVTQAVPVTTRGSTRNRTPLSCNAFGPMYPFTRNGCLAKSLSSSNATSAGYTLASSRLVSTSRSPGTPMASSSHWSVPGWCTFTRTFLSVSAAVNVRPSLALFKKSTSVSIVGVSGV